MYIEDRGGFCTTAYVMLYGCMIVMPYDGPSCLGVDVLYFVLAVFLILSSTKMKKSHQDSTTVNSKSINVT